MAGYFSLITEQNKLSLNKGGNRDAVYYSELNEWFTGNAFRSFSLKFVVDKYIYYRLNKKEYKVNAGSLLLACKEPFVKAYFDSAQTVKSICIDISPATVAEVFTVLTEKNDPDFDNYCNGYFKMPEFFEAVYPVSATLFGNALNELTLAINNNTVQYLVTREWFFNLAENIILQEYGNYLALNNLHSIRLETKKEILRRLHLAKQFMDEQFLFINEIKEAAQACNMSEFHFSRSFKQAFGLTPYHYLLEKRLMLAKKMIEEGTGTITTIAAHCNFADIFTFSKAFKNKFHVAPSQWNTLNQPFVN
ncbi:MAG: helix-turn-helix transcriptional regulator [Bacteroidetes bacterium]|nr:helix-turn-helix transcriptional regulator [Bacteroidota bacterium]MBS1930066.1 helix-turn-helix transcriptional regulator [Bacteroidota bacterium]